MKIGILTFHRAINYGAVLQTFALQQSLQLLGHEVDVIDYLQPRVEKTDRHTFSFHEKTRLLVSLHLRSWWNYDKEKDKRMKQRKNFDEFLDKYLHLSKSCNKDNIPKYDVYIIGSDQVWNSRVCEGLDPVFWGDFIHSNNSKVVSYAASTSVENLKSHNIEEITRLLTNFSAISVREEETCCYINNTYKLKNEAHITLDPTLLAEKFIWDAIIEKEEENEKNNDYVLYFGARTCKKRPNVLCEKAYSLASQLNCDIRTIDFNHDSPSIFVNKIRFAKAIVSSSFHGIAFSLIFNKPLYALLYGDEQDKRYGDLLKMIGAESMLLSISDEIYPKEYDYTHINRKIDELRKKSLKYLKSI